MLDSWCIIVKVGWNLIVEASESAENTDFWKLITSHWEPRRAIPSKGIENMPALFWLGETYVPECS